MLFDGVAEELRWLEDEFTEELVLLELGVRFTLVDELVGLAVPLFCLVELDEFVEVLDLGVLLPEFTEEFREELLLAGVAVDEFLFVLVVVVLDRGVLVADEFLFVVLLAGVAADEFLLVLVVVLERGLVADEFLLLLLLAGVAADELLLGLFAGFAAELLDPDVEVVFFNSSYL